MKTNTEYEILSPEGFVDFLGIQKLKKKTREIFFTNGLTLRTSYNHKIFDFDGNEILVKNVKKEDLIKSRDGYFIIEKVIDYEYESDVYDVVNAGELHLYFTNDIVSHNCDFLGSGDGVIPGSVQQDISKNCIREPKEKYMQGTFWQWKEPVQGHRYLMGCLPPNEKVLTDCGLKNIQEVLITDKLISENGDYVNIINKQIYSVIEEDTFEVSVDNTFRTTTFTKEHPILISKPTLKRNYDKTNKTYRFNERYWDFDFNYVKMENVTVGNWIKVPNIYKKEIIGILEDKWIKTEGIRKDFVIDSPLKNKEFWWFIGMWLGDGWLGKLNNSYTISMCFNSKDEYYLNKTNELIIRLFNRSPSFIDRGRNTFELVFNSKFLYNFIIKNFGQYSFGKKISEWVKFIPNELKIELLKGYLASDGCWLKTEKNGKINSKISFVSINLELLESIQDIIFSLDIVSSLNKLRNSKKSYINGILVQQKETYNLCLANNDSLELIKLLNNDSLDTKLNKFNINDFSIINNRPISSCHLSKDKDFIFFKIKNIKKSKFTGNVYNFECDTHTFMCHHITTHNCDVSRGDSEDYSAINIIDFDEREQVAEYIGKMPPDDLATVCYKWGILYEAFIVIDITGGMGIATSRKLQEMNYKNLYIDGVNTQNIWEYNRKALDKIPGLNFNNKRTQIVSAFEEQLRKGFNVRSSRLLNELSTFVYINGRPDHMKGYHDDSIMSLSMALYAADMCFNQLEKNQNASKAMLESWTISERTYETKKSFYSYGVAFDSIGAMNMGDPENNYFINTPNKDHYKEYSWLFSKRKK
jgi:hypothetical protein